jgi:hypothetical protein
MTRIDQRTPRSDPRTKDQAPVTPVVQQPTAPLAPASVTSGLLEMPSFFGAIPPSLLPQDLAQLAASPQATSGQIEVLLRNLDQLAPALPPQMEPAAPFSFEHASTPGPLPECDAPALLLIEQAGPQTKAQPHQKDAKLFGLLHGGETKEKVIAQVVHRLQPSQQKTVAQLVATLQEQGIFKQINLGTSKTKTGQGQAVGTSFALPEAEDADDADDEILELPHKGSIAISAAMRMWEGADLEMLVTIVMFELSRSAQDDVKALLDQIKKNNAEKAQIRAFVGRAREQKAKVEADLRRQYDERCSIPKTEPPHPRWIDSAQLSFEDFKLSQLLIDNGGLPAPGDGVIPEGTPDVGVSPNETWFDHWDPEAKDPWSVLGAQLKLRAGQMTKLRNEWDGMSAEQKSHFGNDFFTWLLTPASEGGVGLEASPSTSQAGAVSAYFRGQGHTDDAGGASGSSAVTNLSLDELKEVWGLPPGFALALNDYWQTMTAAQRAEYGNDPRRFLQEAVGLQKNKGDQSQKVRSFFNARESELAIPFSPAHYQGATPPDWIEPGSPEHLEWLKQQAALSDMNAQTTIAEHGIGVIQGNDLQAVDVAVRAYMEALVKYQHAKAEGKDTTTYEATMNAKKTAMMSLIKSVQPPASQQVLVEYTTHRVKQFIYELQYAVVAKQSGDNGHVGGINVIPTDILGGSVGIKWVKSDREPHFGQFGDIESEWTQDTEGEWYQRVDDQGGSDYLVDSTWLSAFGDSFYIDPDAIIGTISSLDSFLDSAGATNTWSFRNPAQNEVVYDFFAHDEKYFDATSLGNDGIGFSAAESGNVVISGAVVNMVYVGPGSQGSVSPDDVAFLNKVYTDALPQEEAKAPHTAGLREMTLAEFDARIAAWSDRADALGDISNELSTRLQLAMDRLSKAQQTLSNLIKKFSDTAQTIIGNMK